ncbi:hypothetical protein GGR88_002759 [Sphingomonas jejuensis]|uniref:Polyhydroxyalkanoic acid system protein n=1 Tax=Sphingomonas jejuensis TaxID=904715 RepID=A0ABX0XPL4_9SPHN|nr:polyhydroxyalkanoic acid system family protein [Sphingomonas jejuensis]NJC35245.1 hypothetical protein [Sphingomonas jejuensis]
MANPITVDIPHSLGRDGVRARLDGGVGKIADAIPGGGTVRHSWNGDTMTMSVEAMGQSILSRIEVFDQTVRATVDLPGFLSIFADPIRAAIEKGGPKLLR